MSEQELDLPPEAFDAAAGRRVQAKVPPELVELARRVLAARARGLDAQCPPAVRRRLRGMFDAQRAAQSRRGVLALAFDSWFDPAPQAARGRSDRRHLRFEHEGSLLDVRLERSDRGWSAQVLLEAPAGTSLQAVVEPGGGAVEALLDAGGHATFVLSQDAATVQFVLRREGRTSLRSEALEL